MFRTLTAASLLTMTMSSAAFANGLGPAPHYDPTEGAPASQRGQSVQTLMAEARAHLAPTVRSGNGMVGENVDIASDKGDARQVEQNTVGQ